MLRLSLHFLLLSEKIRRLVPLALLRHFCSVCVCVSVAIPLVRFYTRSVYSYMANSDRKER